MWVYIAGYVVLAALAAAQVPKVPNVPLPPDPRCNGGDIIRGFSYLNHSTRCDCWIRCTFDEVMTVVKSETECCGCGMFWNPDIMTCFPARDVNCINDLCSANGGKSYAHSDSCRTYFTCEGTRTMGGACCDVGQGYDAGRQTCAASSTCEDMCLCVDQTTLKPSGNATCKFLPNPSDTNTYIEYEFGRQIVRPCPPDTSYNHTRCRCSKILFAPKPDCSVDFNLRCNSYPMVDSANNAYIMNNDVTVDENDNNCYFDGEWSNLLLQRYANMDWGEAWSVGISFNGESNDNIKAPLFTNSACAKGEGPASIGIRLDRVDIDNDNSPDPVVDLSVRIDTISYTLRVQYKVDQRNNVFASYNGEVLKLTVEYENGVVGEASVPAFGPTDRVKCTVIIGQDNREIYFTGIIHDIRVYVFCVPESFSPDAQ